MKRIIVTPAGRKTYLDLLLTNLLKCRHEFDEWHLWVNTPIPEDAAHIRYLADKYDFIKQVDSEIPYNGNYTIHHFFKHTANPNEIYIRLDDDICYIRPGSIDRLYRARLADQSSFLIYGNIVNNSVITYLHQHIGAMHYRNGYTGYECMHNVGWHDPKFAEAVHINFLRNLQNHDLDLYKFPDWTLIGFERVSINVISWLGRTFNEFGGQVGLDEEQWLSVEKPRDLNLPNKICGDTLFVHFAFHTQRPHLESTDILDRYYSIANL